ncbi:hypothetical protein OG216_37020 [Streptomycetaceae bacterium NBC_01309]
MATEPNDTGNADERPPAMSLIDRIGRERAEALMEAAVREAAARTEAAGLPIVGFDEHDRVYVQYADGTRTYPED